MGAASDGRRWTPLDADGQHMESLVHIGQEGGYGALQGGAHWQHEQAPATQSGIAATAERRAVDSR
jgi:hypothetical protein